MGDDNGNDNSPGEEQPPPLPPRPSRPSLDSNHSIDARMAMAAATTAVTPLDIQTLSFPDGSRGTFSTPGPRTSVASSKNGSGSATPTTGMNEMEDSMSIMSFAPTMRPAGDIASLLVGEFSRKSPAWNLLRSQSATVQPFESLRMDDTTRNLAGFENEFDELPDEADTDFKDEDRVAIWKSKLKHYMILSSAGKPIYSRHGDLGLINSSMGVIQTIISFYEGAKNPLQAFTAGQTRFVISIQGPLYFVAISRLGESDSQLRAQLEALYMQILSTLTLPVLKNIFVHRPSTDLRKPLEGTEPLISSLADNFTKGSPSALLGALECLKLRKSQRHAINNAFLKQRTEKLLYGLIVAGGKLVSVIRPRRHSLHPSDLQLIFNMLFESGGIKAGGGENWVPLCLPAFNNRGYLYMYVSFFDGVEGDHTTTTSESGANKEEELAIILISPDKESFFELKQMRDNVAASLAQSGHLATIQAAARLGRPKTVDIAPGGQISHFLYKSRANVQFSMSALDPVFSSLIARRRLMTLYHQLHAAVHAKHSHMRVLHSVSEDATSLAWITPIFEFYCVAGPNVSRAVVTQGANKVIQWARREEERIFIIGGGVF
ncbi:Vacuolar fusion protein MON1 [Colletotrichum fructicola]|uniref:Vacuolar fusion protein MON1 n=1 Tax=Colletotrichum fructicola (strain Nara gc5) TaxID=1213859 RepID=L2FNY6_COLFN|nr:Vacuolar fusion protein [Colletotrichum fructicola]XP_053041188.1 Vacuolar fusion protein mon1 [Colletotrichum chrysophilum]KAF4493178.1 Vacuolar fusion protein MON1 [Colletotrichum fructicola Nara gc5]KAF4874669.1 Vacuolar fusion protein MON1 [Colletotrichum siamense]KAE9573265.1 Vacuolar fusion protein [Colletotrichum fructicola]KAF4423554.1 Vacuolar fusion protein MON1 [Colletotrichum fructicola]KAF4888880.1 Vacuolar fusion protein MON1 [Colletotrichum fructicola]